MKKRFIKLTILIIILIISNNLLSCSKKDDSEAEKKHLFKSAQNHLKYIKKGNCDRPENTFLMIDDLLQRSGRTKNDLGLTPEKEKQLVAECYFSTAKSFWNNFTKYANTFSPGDENFKLEKMDENLKKAGKTRADLGITSIKIFQEEINAHYLRTAKYCWEIMVNAYEKKLITSTCKINQLNYYLKLLEMKREDIGILDDEWEKVTQRLLK